MVNLYISVLPMRYVSINTAYFDIPHVITISSRVIRRITDLISVIHTKSERNIIHRIDSTDAGIVICINLDELDWYPDIKLLSVLDKSHRIVQMNKSRILSEWSLDHGWVVYDNIRYIRDIIQYITSTRTIIQISTTFDPLPAPLCFSDSDLYEIFERY